MYRARIATWGLPPKTPSDCYWSLLRMPAEHRKRFIDGWVLSPTRVFIVFGSATVLAAIIKIGYVILFIDATFSITPGQFYQTLNVVGKVNGTFAPIFTVLMTKKDEGIVFLVD